MELPNDKSAKSRTRTRTRSEATLADVLDEVETVRAENQGRRDNLVEILSDIGTLARAIQEGNDEDIRDAGVRIAALAFVISADG